LQKNARFKSIFKSKKEKSLLDLKELQEKYEKEQNLNRQKELDDLRKI
jgi:hypothetical protein